MGVNNQGVDRSLEKLGQFNRAERMVKNSTVASEQNVAWIGPSVNPRIKHFFYRPVPLQKTKNKYE